MQQPDNIKYMRHMKYQISIIILITSPILQKKESTWFKDQLKRKVQYLFYQDLEYIFHAYYIYKLLI